MRYLDFDLAIERRAGDTCVLSVRAAHLGENREPIEVPFAAESFRALLNEVRPSLDGEDIGMAERAAQKFGSALFEAVFPKNAYGLYRDTLAAAQQESKTGVRLTVRTRDPEIALLPWELLYHDHDFLCLSRQSPVVRYLEVPKARTQLTVVAPLRVLCVVARTPEPYEPVDSAKERARIMTGLQRMRRRGRIEVTWLEDCTQERLRETLSASTSGQWHLMHYIGHAEFDETLHHGNLVIASHSGHQSLLSAKNLARMLKDHRSMRVAILNACQGAAGSEFDAFSSMAAELIRFGLPAVVAMQSSLTEDAAIAFSEGLYGSLAEGESLDATLSEARKAISVATPGTLQWATPVLHMRSTDSTLFVRRRWQTSRVAQLAAAAVVLVAVVGATYFRPQTASGFFSRGQTKVRQVDLRGAQQEFAKATTLDSTYAPAWAWQAQMSYLLKGVEEEWGPTAAKALALASHLTTRDSLIASGLASYFAGDISGACKAYDDLTRIAPIDWVGWYGAYDCHYRDNVIADGAGVLRFVTSRHRAAMALDSALMKQPALFDRLTGAVLQNVILSEPQHVLGGAVPETRMKFIAYPEVSGDTIAFVPQDQRTARVPRSWAEALDSGRAHQRRLVERWRRHRPNSPEMLEALSVVHELKRNPDSALVFLEGARRMAAGDAARISRLTHRELQLELKRDSVGEARRMADSILANPEHATPGQLAALAALTGRVSTAAVFQEKAGLWNIGADQEKSAAVQKIGAELLAHAALGVCGPLLDDLVQRVDRSVKVLEDPGITEQEIRSQVLEHPLRFAVACGAETLRLQRNVNDKLVEAQLAFSAGHRETVRSALNVLQQERAQIRAGDVSLDALYPESWLWLSIGDTARAIDQLDAALDGLRRQGTDMLSGIARAGGYVRAMALRAEIAKARGDTAKARSMAARVANLWSEADSVLQPIVQRMNDIQTAQP